MLFYAQTDSNIKHMQKAPRFLGTHTIEITKGSLLHSIFQQESEIVNSFHHQAVKEVGKDFLISAKSKDGLIEAIEHKSLPFVLGVQWHPETMPNHIKLFEMLVEKSKSKK